MHTWGSMWNRLFQEYKPWDLDSVVMTDWLLHFLLIITIYELTPRSDANLLVTMAVTFRYEKPQSSNKSHK